VQTLTERAQALADRSRIFNAALLEAMRLCMRDPEAGLAALQLCWDQAGSLEADDLGLLKELSAPNVFERQEHWRTTRVNIRLMRCRALQALARPDSLRVEIAAAQALLASRPDDPVQADFWEMQAELVSNDAQAAYALLDPAFAVRVRNQQWLAAGQNRMRAAGIAAVAGQLARLRQSAGEAIQIAHDNGLRLPEFQFRIFLFRSLLNGDTSGQVRDELRAQLDYRAGLLGSLPDDVTAAFNLGLQELAALRTAAPAPDFPALLAGAAKTTRNFGFMQVSGALADCAPAPGQAISAAALAAAIDGAEAAFRTALASLRASLLVLAAELQLALDDWQTARDILTEAEEVAADLPESLTEVLGAMSGVYDSRGNTEKAVDFARRAVEVAAALPFATTRAQAQARLDELVSRKGGPEMIKQAAMEDADFVPRRLLAAQLALKNGEPDDSLRIITQIAPLATDPVPRQQLMLARGVTFFELGQLAEAEADFVTAQNFLKTDGGADVENALQFEALAMLIATCQAKAGRPLEAWNSAEAGRSRAMRVAQGATIPDWPAVAAWLSEHQAGVIAFAPQRWGTLVLSAGPAEAMPTALLLADFKARDMLALFQSDLPNESPLWNDKLFAAIPALSEKLIGPLRERIKELAAKARVLHIIPYDLLYLAPFAAVEVTPGQTLDDLLPLAIVPSVTLLLHWASRPAPAKTSCLAVAAGKDTTGFDFSEHLKLIAAAPWPERVTQLSGDAATPAALQAEAGQHAVLALSCHGIINPTVQDKRRASIIELANKSRVTAPDVAGWTGVPEIAFSMPASPAVFARPAVPSWAAFPANCWQPARAW
jgi:tetratricopeptide (TPR) repeat protein